jgi:alkaline phosphatase
MPCYKYLTAIFFLLLWSSCQSQRGTVTQSESGPKRPQNIVLMIGDGMGLAQITAALYSNSNRLALENFPVVGFHKSYAGNDLVTDSAAGATAFSCGIKTYTGAVGVNMDTTACKTILEEAEERGLATGMVATSTIVHATPAAFAAHSSIRYNYEEIAADIMDLDIDLLIGGGKKYFDRREEDERNLYLELQNRGYFVSDYFKENLDQIYFNTRKNFVYFTADTQPPAASLGRKYLPYASSQAVRYLSNRGEKGFFLLIEGSQIDWGGHSRNSEIVITETLDFDQAIKNVYDFARRDGNTLVIVTADHETGGLAINPGSEMDNLNVAFTSNYHTAALIPVFAYGPGAEKFAGIYENTAVNAKMRELLGFNDTAAKR